MSNISNVFLSVVGFANVPCYCSGTHILTKRGEIRIEALEIGDRVVLLDGRVEPIRWIGRRSYDGRFLAAAAHLLPVRFAAGSFGGGLPHRDLFVSPDHAMYLDGVLVPARLLINGTTIVQQRGADRVDYIHLELAQHAVILAEGAPAESFLDDGSRGLFQNAADHLAPLADGGAKAFCAPRVESGFALHAIQQRLAQPRAA